MLSRAAGCDTNANSMRVSHIAQTALADKLYASDASHHVLLFKARLALVAGLAVLSKRFCAFADDVRLDNFCRIRQSVEVNVRPKHTHGRHTL